MQQATIASYVRKHTLWQAIGGATIRMIRSIDTSIVVQLIANGKVLATEEPTFRTYKARNEAFDRAAETGTLEFIAGTTVRA